MPLLRKAIATRRGGLPTFKPAGLAPQQAVSGLTNNDPTRDTYQRKIFYDGTNFFLFYWVLADKRIYYVASSDGITWTSPTSLVLFSIAPYSGGNADINYPERGALSNDLKRVDMAMVMSGSNGASFNWDPYQISGQTLTQVQGSSYASSGAQGGSVLASLNLQYDYYTFHSTTGVWIGRSPASDSDQEALTLGTTTTGGNQILPYKTSSPHNVFVLAKDASSVLKYIIGEMAILDIACRFTGSFVSIATLNAGFSDFCGCSEAQEEGDPERIHIVYVKSTGELCYRKFESDTLGNEKVLVSSGASYPVIAAGSNGKLYVFYVKDSKIWVIHYNGSKWFKAVELFTKDHTYSTPTYLSCNQYVQTGKICLVWCEAEDGTYAVWFCYLED